MKTAEEILDQFYYDDHKEGDTVSIIKAMKLYANQKLDEAAEKALVMLVEQDGDPIDTTDMYCVHDVLDNRGKPTYVIADRESILSLKDNI